MKIRIMYDNKSTYLEVPDEDCTVMIDMDYEDRLFCAEDKETVTRRSPQEIMDERFNKPEYNNWHKLDRHSAATTPPKKLNGKRVESGLPELSMQSFAMRSLREMSFFKRPIPTADLLVIPIMVSVIGIYAKVITRLLSATRYLKRPTKY